MKLPALQFYVGDWRKDLGVQSLTFKDRGIWFEMLCLMHESEDRGKLVLKGKAITDDHIARILGLDNQIFKDTLTSLLESGVAVRDPDSGAIMSKRMVKDENIRKVRKECGKQGGNPNLVNQKPTTKVKVTPKLNAESEDEDESEDHLTLKLAAPDPELDEEVFVDEIYALYPRKVDPSKAKAAIRRSITKHTSILVRQKTLEYAKVVEEIIPNKAERRFVPHPATWFNAGGFLSDPDEWRITLRRNHQAPAAALRIQKAANEFPEVIQPKILKI